MSGAARPGRRVLRVGLTGGIGSGKSATSRLLAERGATVVDADVLAREAVAPGTPGLRRVVEAFGPGVLAADGTLDRAAVAEVVFRDPLRRAELDAIVHPVVRALAAERELAAPDGAVVVHDVPLLVETGQQGGYDVVVVVDVPVEMQLRRLVEGRGMEPGEARRRVEAQAGRERRLAAATVVLDGSGPLSALSAQVDGLWRTLATRAGQLGPPS